MVNASHSTTPPPDDDHPVVLFDGVCNLCHGTVRFIVRRDTQEGFRFASLQSEFARNALEELGLDSEEPASLVLLDRGIAWRGSDAALQIASRLRFPWPILGWFRFLPLFVRDPIYYWVARNRYRWFGKKDQCPTPSPDLKDRFLDQ